MSIKALNWAFALDLSGKQSGLKFVLVALANYADENDSCFPSVEKLAQLTGQGIRTVRYHLAEAQALNLVRKEPRATHGGRSQSNRYYLQTHQKVAAPGAVDVALMPLELSTGVQSPHRPGRVIVDIRPRQAVVIMRERKGRSVPFVADDEGDAASTIIEHHRASSIIEHIHSPGHISRATSV